MAKKKDNSLFSGNEGMQGRSAPTRRIRPQQVLTIIGIVFLCAALVFLYFYKTPEQKQKEDAFSALAAKQSSSDVLYQDKLAQNHEADASKAQAAASLAVSAPEPIAAPIPREEWYMLLVNHEHPLPEDFDVDVEPIDRDGRFFDARAVEPLLQMLEACEAEGLQPFAISGSCSREFQQSEFERRVRTLEQEGMSKEEADAKARRENMAPGENEHNLGLAIDIVAKNNQRKGEDFLQAPEYLWLVEHAPEYGFIQRYPLDKAEITGVEFEPWHFRYVGAEQAKLITESGLCLEEYLA